MNGPLFSGAAVTPFPATFWYLLVNPTECVNNLDAIVSWLHMRTNTIHRRNRCAGRKSYQT